MKTLRVNVSLLTAALSVSLAALSAQASDLRVQCYSDGNECEVTGDIAKRFEAANPGTKIIIDKVPYKAVVETLPVQLAAGEGPDIARVTDLGGLNKFYLDLTPYLGSRAKYWEDNFGPSLKWLRGGPADKGPAHRDRRLRQQDPVRAGQGGHAAGHRHLG